MPQYEDLARRALLANASAETLQIESRRLRGLAQLLREAHAGRVLLTRCAWCDRFKIGEEWLRLEAIGSGQQQIASSVREQATHGICPRCLSSSIEASERARASRAK